MKISDFIGNPSQTRNIKLRNRPYAEVSLRCDRACILAAGILFCVKFHQKRDCTMCSAPVDETTGIPLPTRKSVRHMRWFEHSFWARMAATSAQIGVYFHISDRLLADTFLSWHRVFDSQKPASRMVRRSYVSFVAGTMLHELLRKKTRVGSPKNWTS